MKMSADLYGSLERAVAPHMSGVSVRARWDALWASKFPVMELYRAGLNDDHIDTALRRIQRGE